MVRIGQIGGDNEFPEQSKPQQVRKENEWDKPILQFKGDVNGDGYVGADEIENEHGFNLTHIIGMRWADVIERVGQFFGIKSATVIFKGKNEAQNQREITIDIDEQGMVTSSKDKADYDYNGSLKSAVYTKTNIKYDEHGYPIEYDKSASDYHPVAKGYKTQTKHENSQNKYNAQGQLIERTYGSEGDLLTRESYDYEKNTVTIQLYHIKNGKYVKSGTAKTLPINVSVIGNTGDGYNEDDFIIP